MEATNRKKWVLIPLIGILLASIGMSTLILADEGPNMWIGFLAAAGIVGVITIIPAGVIYAITAQIKGRQGSFIGLWGLGTIATLGTFIMSMIFLDAMDVHGFFTPAFFYSLGIGTVAGLMGFEMGVKK